VTSGAQPRVLTDASFHCPLCRKKLVNLGPGMRVPVARAIVRGEPLRPGEIDAFCDGTVPNGQKCDQRWALTVVASET